LLYISIEGVSVNNQHEVQILAIAIGVLSIAVSLYVAYNNPDTMRLIKFLFSMTGG
jgi:hypothetical protein